MCENSDETIKGELLKIVHLDEETGTVFVRYSDGRTARLNNVDFGSFSANDVILAHEGGFQKVPAQVWPHSQLTSIVRKILSDGTVLGESGSAIIVLSNPDGLNLELDFTVEFDSGNSAITRIISKEPIRARQHLAEEELSPASFLVKPQADGLSFENFGGYPSVVARAKELIETQLERRDELEKIGARPVKGILFTGPPGTGKTHLARIIANQAGADFYDISGPAIVSKWVGDTEELLRKIFEHAKNSDRGKAIIFFDEIDSIAESRTGDSHEASRRLVAQFLTLMDGFETNKNATVVIAATNRAEALDPALTRPGRFDWEIEFGLPSLDDRIEILTIGTQSIRCSSDLPLVEIATRAHDWSAARLTSIWTEAALIAASDKREKIAGEDLAQAFERVSRRPERKMNGKSER
ncbi:26S protease regulatory subunit [Thioclava sp. JE_KL1]|uniref:ATP-binding protein n=1 Tax=Thioclava sp. JE_KL1 TaxID=2651187 RepID=UPI00128BB9F7|nr:ATP-binding protein [Thioclava sp. JE_KL1]MPQ93227.1 26S protease regulatory subunit [Thioclava sp. JE_KL1]